VRKEDVAVDDDDDDVVRTSVLQTRVTATLCTGIVPQDSANITLFTYQSGESAGGGRKRMVNRTHRAVPVGFTLFWAMEGLV
jgi:hypothetical protein